jgi:hypothetical protein
MAKYKVIETFKGLKEDKFFETGEEIELTVKRAEEINQNTKRDYDVTVLERLDEQAPADEKSTKTTETEKKD